MSIRQDNVFYVYEHWRSDRNECFYVGKGKGYRANNMRYGRNRLHKSIQAKLSRLWATVEVRIIADGLSEASAFALECERIAFWRANGVGLANWTNGGDGPAGYKQSLEHRQKIADSMKAYYSTAIGQLAHAKLVEAAIAANTGRALTPQTKSKMSKIRKAMARTPCQLAIGRLGANKTPQHIAAIAAAKASARARRLASEPPGAAEARNASRRERRSAKAAERYRLSKAKIS